MPGPAQHHRRRPLPRPAVCATLISVLLMAASPPLAAAPSDLLERVKQNPQQARSLCKELKALNAQGISALSSQGIASVAQRQGLDPLDAEVLITYVVGLHCPNVR